MIDIVFETVIASEAKQSIARTKAAMDCFVALLLAKTWYLGPNFHPATAN
jgi:hypothetical protein